MSHDLLFTNETSWYAQDLRAVYDALSEGVGDAAGGELEVTDGATGISVDVAAGVGYVQGDAVVDQGLYRVLVESPTNSDAFLIGFNAAHASLPRIDQIIARVYDDEMDSSGQTAFQLEVLSGTPTSGADLTNHDGAAALPDTAMPLAYVLVPATATSISSSEIEDVRTEAMPAGGGGGGGAIEVSDGGTTVSPASELLFDSAGFNVDDGGGGVALVYSLGGGGGGMPARDSATFSTASIADGVSHQEDLDLSLASVRFYYLSASAECRVRIYMDPSFVAGDAARPVGTDPVGFHGVLLDTYMAYPDTLELGLSPQVDASLFNLPGTFPVVVTNESGVTGAINIELRYLPVEENP